MFKFSTTILVAANLLATLTPVRTAPTLVARHEGHSHGATSASGSSLIKENALRAQQLNSKFASVKASDACQGDEQACINGAFAQCVQGKWAVHAPCASSLRCYALPLVLKSGVALVCDTPEGANKRFQDAGVSGGTKGTDAAPVEEDEDIDDCDEEDEIEGRAFAEDEEYHYFYKRQVVPDEPVTLAEVPSNPLPTTTSPLSSAVSAIATSSSSSAAVTPTVVIGTDGIVTVTVVSTVFAAPTDCANGGSASASAFPTPITVSRASPIVSASPSSIVSSAVTVRPTAFSSVSARPSNVISLSAATTSLSASARPTAVNNSGNGFSFTFARRSLPTPGAA